MELIIRDASQRSVLDIASREEVLKERRKDQDRHHHKQIWTKQPHGGPYTKVQNLNWELLLGYDVLCLYALLCREIFGAVGDLFNKIAVVERAIVPGIAQCDARGGYDPLLELPNGRRRVIEPGYERPQRGPTTNFVGNHMTQVMTGIRDCRNLAKLQLNFHSNNSIASVGLKDNDSLQGAIDLVQMELEKAGPLANLKKLPCFSKHANSMPHLLDRRAENGADFDQRYFLHR